MTAVADGFGLLKTINQVHLSVLQAHGQIQGVTNQIRVNVSGQLKHGRTT